MNNDPTPGHQLINKVTDVSWAAAGATGVTLTVRGQTNSSDWTELLLAPSTSHPSEPAHLRFDALGLPGGTDPVAPNVSIQHDAPAGDYDVTVYSATNSATTHVNYPLGDGHA
jgi:hypothetical protein